MNWWSAHQWCQAQGYSFITPEKSCNHSTATQNFTWQDGSCRPVGHILGSDYRCYFNKLAKDGYAIKHFQNMALTEPIGATHAWWALYDEQII